MPYSLVGVDDNGKLPPEVLTALGNDFAPVGVTEEVSRRVSKGELLFNVKDYGALGNGSTDDGAAIEAAITALTAVPNSFGQVGVLYFPPGRYLDSLSHGNSDAKRFNVRGAGKYVTTVQRSGAATGDWWTFNASFSGARDMTFEGGRYQSSTSSAIDSVVLNGGYTFLSDVAVNKSRGDGIAIGKAGPAIAHSLHNLTLRENAGHGIYVHPASGATDGLWSNLDIGNSGLNGLRLDTGSQNLTNVHAWGSGIEAVNAEDKDGIWLNSSGNSLTGNCQSEKNIGRGLRLTASSNKFVGGYIWGNVLGAVYGLGANHCTIVANQFYRNVVSNSAGSTSAALAVILLENCTRCVIVGNDVWDNAAALDPGNYVTTPTTPYPGRSAQFTHAIVYAETGTSDMNVVQGNTFPRELTRLGSALSPLVIVGNNDRIEGNDLGTVLLPTRSVTSGAVRCPADSDTIIVAVSQEITSVLGHRAGRVVRIIFTATTPSAVRDNNGTLNLAGDFTPATGSVLTLLSDGTNWKELTRSS